MDPDDLFLTQCQNDERKGVVELVNKWHRSYEKQLELKQHFIQMSEFEESFARARFFIDCGHR